MNDETPVTDGATFEVLSPLQSGTVKVVRAELAQQFERELERIKRLECPWPESVWPMKEQEYVKAVPDEAARTAISGFLMRLAWNEAMRQINKSESINVPFPLPPQCHHDDGHE